MCLRLEPMQDYQSLIFVNSFSVTRQTYRNWMKGEPPGHVATCLQLLAGDLSFLSKSWKGFRIYDGDLWTPEGDRVTAGDVRAVDYCDMTIRFQSNHIRRSETEITELKKSLENSKFQFDLPANDAVRCHCFLIMPTLHIFTTSNQKLRPTNYFCYQVSLRILFF